MPHMEAVRRYYYLTKPGIVYGNIISLAAGFFLAAQRDIELPLLLAAAAGTALVIGCGCVLNNLIDREIDSRMERTRKRALPQGTVSMRGALIYAAVLALAGFGILTFFTNTLTVYVGLAGLYFYVVAYGIWKRRSPAGTIVGSLSGSAPILAGYTAYSGRLDLAAALIFLSMCLWQMPHFYAIAIFRLKDYRAAGLPVLPAVRGISRAKRQIMIYIAAFTLETAMLSVAGYTGGCFVAGIALLGGWWFWQGARTYRSDDDTAWARRMFGRSLLAMTGLSLLLVANPFLP